MDNNLWFLVSGWVDFSLPLQSDHLWRHQQTHCICIVATSVSHHLYSGLLFYKLCPETLRLFNTYYSFKQACHGETTSTIITNIFRHHLTIM